MNLEDLPPGMRKAVEMLKHGSSTIQSDIEDALDEAEDIGHFRTMVYAKMQALIGEAQNMVLVLGTGKGMIVHG